VSSSNQQGESSRSSAESAFPTLSNSFETLPEIPGGWNFNHIDLGTQQLAIHQPANPDLFLDNEDVIQANNKNDYMPYWTFLWPSAIHMARAVLTDAAWEVGTELLELGSGIGLVGLAAQSRGDQVTYSDYDDTALHLCRWNALKNGFSDPPVISFDWREPPEKVFPVIIGCEVTYEAGMHEVILDLLDRMLTPNGICWLGDPGRYQSPYFYQMAIDRGWDVSIRDEHGTTIDAPRSANFQLFELRRR